MDPEYDCTSRMLDSCATIVQQAFPTLHNTVINDSNRASQQQQHAFGSGDKIMSRVVVDSSASLGHEVGVLRLA